MRPAALSRPALPAIAILLITGDPWLRVDTVGGVEPWLREDRIFNVWMLSPYEAAAPLLALLAWALGARRVRFAPAVAIAALGAYVVQWWWLISASADSGWYAYAGLGPDTDVSLLSRLATEISATRLDQWGMQEVVVIHGGFSQVVMYMWLLAAPLLLLWLTLELYAQCAAPPRDSQPSVEGVGE